MHQYTEEPQNITDSISTTEKKSEIKSETNTKEDNVNNEKLAHRDMKYISLNLNLDGEIDDQCRGPSVKSRVY